MKSLQSITELFKSHVTDAQNFSAWAEDGAVFCGQGPYVDGYTLEYTAIVYIQSAAIQPHILFMHLVNWLNRNDPDRLGKGLPFPTFATEVLDDGKCDIKIKIDLQEEYSLQENKLGNWMQDGTRYECTSEFEPAAEPIELNDLVYVVGHKEDLPCQN